METGCDVFQVMDATRTTPPSVIILVVLLGVLPIAAGTVQFMLWQRDRREYRLAAASIAALVWGLIMGLKLLSIDMLWFLPYDFKHLILPALYLWAVGEWVVLLFRSRFHPWKLHALVLMLPLAALALAILAIPDATPGC